MAVLRFAVLAAMVLTAGAGRGDDDFIKEDDAPANNRQDGEFIDLISNFDANLFEQTSGLVLHGNGAVRGNRGLRGPRRPSPTGIADGPEESPTLARLRREGLERLERLQRTCELSAAQRNRLALALESDARRVAAEIDTTRSRYAGEAVNFQEPQGQRKWQDFQQDIQRCRMALQHAFGKGSLFIDLLGGLLDERQWAELTREMRARRSFRWQAIVAPVLLRMDETLGLDAAQYAAIERLLIAAEPRLALDAPPGRRNTHAEQMLVYLQLSQIDTTPIRERLTPRQWMSVSMMMNQGKAMKSWLDQQGLVEAER